MPPRLKCRHYFSESFVIESLFHAVQTRISADYSAACQPKMPLNVHTHRNCFSDDISALIFMWGWSTRACLFGLWFWIVCVCVWDGVLHYWSSACERSVSMPAGVFQASWVHLLWHVAYASLCLSLSLTHKLRHSSQGLTTTNHRLPFIWRTLVYSFITNWMAFWVWRFWLGELFLVSFSVSLLSSLVFVVSLNVSTGSFSFPASLCFWTSPLSLVMTLFSFYEGAGLGCRVFGLVHRLHLMLADWLICSFLVNEL